MPELDASAPQQGDLADLLRANGYQLGGESPNIEYISRLPREIKARVSALKANQLKGVEIESEFYAKVHELEKQFEAKFNKVFEERRKIVSGEYEPKPEEATLPIFHGASEDEIKELNEKSEEYKGEKGIPNFWLQVFKTAESVGDMIQEHDEPILKHLTDVTTTVDVSPPGFSIYFHFSENPYFKNAVLKKTYILDPKYDPQEPFDYDGPSVEKCSGDKIDWLEGKDVTKKVVKKKQKKGANAGKFLTKTVKADSFFNFFDPPQPKAEDERNEDDEDEEEVELLQADFELGQIIRDHVVPRAVLFFTGEAADDDMFDDFADEGDDDEDEEDEDE